MADLVPGRAVASIDIKKVTHYLLNTGHPDGAGKAKFFIDRGFSPTLPQEMVESLLGHVRQRTILSQRESAHGTQYVVSCNIETPDGSNPCVRSVWIVRNNETIPRLVSAIPGIK
ncbi:DUF6883 domain-containing protein [Acetobacter sp. DsW_063]|uniref:DUF6883 domain-containing protein n=1 Tax=Acetobacter sp. DsW_063 TaxID=1514894 RepID=UPI000A3CC982|nr:hypothetical protein HK28_14305 [Acetobacter sp. DsW_063]